MFKKLLSICLSLVLAFPFCMPVFAEDMDAPVDEPVVEEYTYVSSINTNLVIRNGNASASVTVSDLKKNTTKIHVKMTLQKKSGASWNNVVSWEKTTTTHYLSLSKSRAVGEGTYRVKCVTTAYKDSISETATTYSDTATY